MGGGKDEEEKEGTRGRGGYSGCSSQEEHGACLHISGSECVSFVGPALTAKHTRVCVGVCVVVVSVVRKRLLVPVADAKQKPLRVCS